VLADGCASIPANRTTEGDSVKRLVVIGLVLATSLVSAVAVAGTSTALTGTAEWSGGTLEHPATVTGIHGAFEGKLGRGTYEGTLTGGPSTITAPCNGPVCQPVSGTITFTGARGSFVGVVEPGSVVGLVDIASHSWRNFDLTLAITDGTRRYAHADGLLTLSYTSTFAHYFDFDANVFVSTISDEGALTGELRRGGLG
jgi:hypothetical protein